MSLSKRFKHRNKIVVAALATTAALGGGVGVAAAGGSEAPSQKALSGPAAEQGEATEQNEATEQEEPALNGSIQTQEVAGENEQQEQQRLSSQAKVSQADAEQAALAAVPGKVTASELGNENGSLIWEVDVTKADGSSAEVKVDAGNGDVLAQEADDESGEEESGEQGEAGEASTG